MLRTTIKIALAVMAVSTVLASSAQACISCNYRPEVADTPVPGQSHAKKRFAVAPQKAVKQRVANQAKPVQKKYVAPKKVQVAKAEPAAPAQPKAKPAPSAAVAEAASETSDATPAQTQVAELGCSKFIAAVGTTVTVPCE